MPKTKRATSAGTGRTKAAAGPPQPKHEPKHRWTFLTNHSHVLILLHANPGMLLREVAARVGITERAVQQIIVDLEEAGFVDRERIGRQNHYHVKTRNPLRHPVEAHCRIADLLNMVVNHPRAKDSLLARQPEA
ncbi:MAG: MarR family transcriptional regulator [Planctomycetota bacterium]|nr:MAG: MarR family transcriptional regulator [Planctomycetota bacterium]